MTEQISRERIARFWRKCGFREIKGVWFDPTYDRDRCDLPELSLDNLFRWAVPAATVDSIAFTWWNGDKTVTAIVNGNCVSTAVRSDNPALALFRALEKALEDKP